LVGFAGRSVTEALAYVDVDVVIVDELNRPLCRRA